MILENERERYVRAGTDFADAWRRLAAGCDFPPSFECFWYGLEFARADDRTLSAGEYATRLVENYQRIPLYRDPPPA